MSFVCRNLKGKMPEIENALYIGDNSVLMGDIRLGKNVNIWPNCTIRADFASIIIGDNTNIQDNSVIHVSHCADEDYKNNSNGHVIIGKNTTIGHSCIIHACSIGDDCLIGMGSIIADGVVIENGALIGAGSNVTPGTVVRTGELWFGNPAKFMRNIRYDDMEYIKNNVTEYIKLAESLKSNIKDNL